MRNFQTSVSFQVLGPLTRFLQRLFIGHYRDRTDIEVVSQIPYLVMVNRNMLRSFFQKDGG